MVAFLGHPSSLGGLLRKRIFLFVVIASVSLLTNIMFASPVGDISVENCGGVSGVTFTLTTVTWFPSGTVAGTGCIDTGGGTSLSYSGGTLGSGVAGNIKNLTLGGGAVDQFMSFPATSPVLDFILSGLGPGLATTDCTGLSVGASCSPSGGDPFILTNVGGGFTAVSLSADGVVADAAGTSNWAGEFTTQLNLAPDVIQTTILGGGSITSTFSGEFIVTGVTGVPEPRTTATVLIGGVLLVSFVRKRKSRV